jgi:hypothetical protein
VRQQVLLPGLSEHKAIDRKACPQIWQALLLLTEGQHGNSPFHAGAALHWIDPIRFKVVFTGWPCYRSKVKELGPRIVTLSVHPPKLTQAESQSQVLANRVPLVAMNPSFTLLQIHRIGGQVPVVNHVAVRVEV